MSKAISRRRGTTAQHNTFVGRNGEITVDTDKKTVVVHDGVTPGGNPLASSATVDTKANQTSLADAYSSSLTYEIDDVCTYLGARYKCTTAIASPESWNAAHWADESTQVVLDDHASQLAAITTDMTELQNTGVDTVAREQVAKVAPEWKTIVGGLIHVEDASLSPLTIDSAATVKICGKNIFDQSTLVSGKIKNDSGVEIADGSSSYYNQYIPVEPGMQIALSFAPQRIYRFDASKAILSRGTSYPGQVFTVPTGCYFVQIQIITANASGNKQIEFGATSTTYAAYTMNTTGTPYSPIMTAFNDTHAEMSVTYQKQYRSITIPACGDFAIWEPTSTTSDYSTPNIAAQVDLALSYAGFLTAFYDVYVGTANDGYSVTKKSLGKDSSNAGYELFEYDFVPKRYNRTILLSAGMNSIELSTIFGLAYFIKHVMEKSDTGMEYIHDNVRIKVLPIICPWSFDQSPMLYANYNGVNLNMNFSYLNSWSQIPVSGGNSNKGTAPDSEAETVILKRWLSENGKSAELWIDCHAFVASSATDWLHTAYTSDASLASTVAAAQVAITNYYIGKGLFASGAVTSSGAWAATVTDYPKTLYAKAVCGIPAVMIEQLVSGTWYGGDGSLNNDEADIRNYLLTLRAFVLAILHRSAIEYTDEDLLWMVYQHYRTVHGK